MELTSRIWRWFGLRPSIAVWPLSIPVHLSAETLKSAWMNLLGHIDSLVQEAFLAFARYHFDSVAGRKDLAGVERRPPIWPFACNGHLPSLEAFLTGEHIKGQWPIWEDEAVSEPLLPHCNVAVFYRKGQGRPLVLTHRRWDQIKV